MGKLGFKIAQFMSVRHGMDQLSRDRKNYRYFKCPDVIHDDHQNRYQKSADVRLFHNYGLLYGRSFGNIFCRHHSASDIRTVGYKQKGDACIQERFQKI